MLYDGLKQMNTVHMYHRFYISLMIFYFEARFVSLETMFTSFFEHLPNI